MRIATMLFVPGHDAKKMLKLPVLAADAFILDLEDAVAELAKPLAREQVRRTIEGYSGAPEVHVRVNSFVSHHLYDDLQAVVVPKLRGVVLPKATDQHEIRAVDWALSGIERLRDIPPGTIEILPLIESVAGLERVTAIALSSARIRRLGFGAHDFSLDAGLEWPTDTEEMSPTVAWAKSAVVLASKRNGLEPPHDGAYADFRDQSGLAKETHFAKRLGFFGKHAIHPAQVPTIRQIFQWTEDDIEQAREIVRRFDSSEAAGIAAIGINGQMIDYATAERARRLLENV